MLPDAGLNVYDVLRRHTLVLTRAAVMAINARFEVEAPGSRSRGRGARQEAARQEGRSEEGRRF